MSGRMARWLVSVNSNGRGFVAIILSPLGDDS